ncbi:MAG: VanZ family protein [Rhodoferax sp.]|uniref:VanZ family protein n=1 Tax=Rhodoferax sp. TaxID=50421 RepID=UPI0027165749|nr:VanZ family protein [Rhodoferax sp.]MDO8450874.1 VanZ family protein [Rhodoferax sp.]
MKRLLLFALIAGLIVYGSLYPFNFSPATPGAVARLFSNWNLLTSPGDLLGNGGLFAPWGLIGMLALAPRWGLPRAAAMTALSGFVISLGVQVLQIWVPSRDAALADVFWNLIGIAGGIVVGGYFTMRLPGKTVDQHSAVVPASLLVAFVVAEWLPLVPSIDLQLIKEQLKSLWTEPTLSTAVLLQQAAMAVLAGQLLAALTSTRRSVVLLPLLLMAISLGKFFMHGVRMDMSAPLGFALGAASWWALARIAETRRGTIIWLLLLTGYTVSALSPFSLRDEPAAVSWLPFSAMLEGSMASNVRSLASNMVVFAGILYVAATASRRVFLASIGLALWVFLLELMQTLIETRTSDMTEPLLVLLLGQVFGALHLHENSRSKAQKFRKLSSVSGESPGPAKSQPKVVSQSTMTRPRLKVFVLQTTVAVATIVLGIAVLLKLPGIPYNVKQLFRGDGSIPALFAFSMALLWAGGGAVWLGTRLTLSRWPGLQLPPLALLVSLISLAFLWAGVTTESIEDISGSANVFWWVTNRDTWGEFWRRTFLYLDAPAAIGFIEHCVRYIALYAPLPIFLALVIALRAGSRHAFAGVGPLSGLVVSALLLLWLCKAIAFDWTSTDNLNELIARDGEWGWGGGGFLYGLLLLFCINGLLLGEAAGASRRKLALMILLSLAALPLGWWLLNQGLEQHIEKYSFVFSGPQFLLGPDRAKLLSPEVLFLRWCLVQVGGVLILATGIRLGESSCCAHGSASIRKDGI